jgi:hypothetical protein
LRWLGLAVVAALCGAFAPGIATAQSIADEAPPQIEDLAGDVQPAEPLVQQPYVPELAVEPSPSPLEMDYSGQPYAYDAHPVVAPVNWISGPYFKSGVDWVIGDDVLQNQKTGYTISGGYRQALAPALAGDRAFFDVGGSYLSAFGDTTRHTDGRQRTVLGTIVDDAFLTTMNEIRRGSAHLALGWYWGPALDDRSSDPQVRIATRFGGRLGHMRGVFHDVRVKDPILGGTMATTYGDTDTFGGLFFGAEAILLRRYSPLGHIQLTLDSEYANDWVRFDGFESGSLGTASLMLGFMLSR